MELIIRPDRVKRITAFAGCGDRSFRPSPVKREREGEGDSYIFLSLRAQRSNLPPAWCHCVMEIASARARNDSECEGLRVKSPMAAIGSVKDLTSALDPHPLSPDGLSPSLSRSAG